MRLVFDINAGEDTHEVFNDLRDFVLTEIGRITCKKDMYLLPSPDLYSNHPLLERKYKHMLYALAGNLLDGDDWITVFKHLAIGFDDPQINGLSMYNEDWWSRIHKLTVGTVSSKSYDMPYSELIGVIKKRYSEIKCMHDSDIILEWLDINNCDIYSEETGRVLHVDYVGSRIIMSVLCTRKLMNDILQSDSYPVDSRVSVYTVENNVFEEDDDDDVLEDE